MTAVSALSGIPVDNRERIYRTVLLRNRQRATEVAALRRYWYFPGQDLLLTI